MKGIDMEREEYFVRGEVLIRSLLPEDIHLVEFTRHPIELELKLQLRRETPRGNIFHLAKFRPLELLSDTDLRVQVEHIVFLLQHREIVEDGSIRRLGPEPLLPDDL